MKDIKRIFVIAVITFLSFSCSKHDDEEIVDCFGESILVELKHSADAGNSKKINYSIQYSGSKTITSIKWTFGDGSPVETGSGLTTSHTYSAAGTFEVKADVTLGSCTVSPKKNVTVN